MLDRSSYRSLETDKTTLRLFHYEQHGTIESGDESRGDLRKGSFIVQKLDYISEN